MVLKRYTYWSMVPFFPSHPVHTVHPSLLQGKLKIFDECWKRVPSGEDLVNDFIMFTYDVPLSKSFVPDHLAIFNERYRLMMKMHTEFTSLSRLEQARITDSPETVTQP